MGNVVCCTVSKRYKDINLHLYQINRYYSEADSLPKIPEMMEPSPLMEPRNQSEVVVDSSAITKDSNTLDRKFSIPLNGENSLKNKLSSNDSKDSNEKEINFKKKQILKNKNGVFQLLSYDIIEERFSTFKIIFPIIKSIEGLSELYIKNKYFLCGISPKQKNEGSFLFKINLEGIIEDEEINAQILINSQNPHVYPSLISDTNDQIICVGGKGQTNCELYNCNLNKWYVLPSLPEERYKCNLCLDPTNMYVYLFGGINSQNKKNKSKNESINQDNQDNDYKILRMHLIKQLIWENILVKNNNKNLFVKRFSAGCFTFQNDEDFIFILGGEDSENKYLDTIIRYSVKTNKFESTGLKLNCKAKFMNQRGLLNDDEQTYYFIDSLNQIHDIARHDCLPMNYNIL